MTSALDLSSASRLMAGAGKTFYKAGRFLPKATRREVIKLYAFCRRVDDLADDPSSPLEHRLEALEALAQTLAHGSAKDLLAEGWPFPSGGALAGAAIVLVRAAIRDLTQQQPATEADLMAYAFDVAGTVGIMMAEVLGAEPEGYRAAVALGMAMQLSNIARDVAEDLHQERVYLPAAWVTAERVAAALQQGDIVDGRAVREATQRLLALAEPLYEAAYDGIWSLPWRVRWSILAAGMCYREIGIQVGKNVERSWRQRAVVSGWRKGWLIALAGVRLLFPRFWLPRFWRLARRTRLNASRNADRNADLGDAALRQMRELGVAG